MRALVFRRWRTFPELIDVPVPVPEPDEVLLRVAGSGACHSDIQIYDGYDASSARGFPPPFILGHEVSGWVERCGADVTGIDLGQAGVVYAPIGCGSCPHCRSGEDMRCRRVPAHAPRGIGIGRDGGMAEFVVVPARNLVALGSADPVASACLADAALTPFHAIRSSSRQLDSSDRTALVIGLGGLGQLAVQCLRALSGARILAVDTREGACSEARTNGAEAMLSGPDTLAALRRSVPEGVDAVFDFVGSTETLALAVGVVAPQGRVTVLGIAAGVVPWTYFDVPSESELTTSFWGSRAELRELVQLYEEGVIVPRIERFSLEEAPEAYRRLEAGLVNGRAVIVPSRGG